jgi:hypothetical protein
MRDINKEAAETALEKSQSPFEKFSNNFENSVNVDSTEKAKNEAKIADYWEKLVNEDNEQNQEDNADDSEYRSTYEKAKNEVKIADYWDKLVNEDNEQNQEDKTDNSEYPSTLEERIQQTPREGDRGHWEGERGESKYVPTDHPEIIDILKKDDLDGIDYKDGIPDFSEVSESTVEIDNMTDDRQKNFEQCDEKCAEQWNKEERDGRTDWNARDVANWRRENVYSWHERNDLKTCDLVPTKINAYFGHLGGVGEYKTAKSKDGGFDE